MLQKLNNEIAVIGIDIGKNSFHIVGQDQRGSIVLRQKWSRAVLRPVKAWPGSAAARCKPSATASLDGPCARRPCASAGRDEGTAARRKQRNSIKQGSYQMM
jgi:hypothetical protein